jgi:hypothetical protein
MVTDHTAVSRVIQRGYWFILLVAGLLVYPARCRLDRIANTGRVMSIIPFLAQSAFEPEMVDFLVSVYEDAWNRVEQSGSKLASPGYRRAAQELLAKRIIETAQRGERDPNVLADDAMKFLERSYA